MRLGKYEVLLELASGGMGVVHVARQVGDAGFSRLVVVKRLHDHLAKEPEFHDMVRDGSGNCVLPSRVFALIR